MDDALEPDDGEEAGREAADPGEQQNRKGDETGVAGIFGVSRADTTHLARRFLGQCTRRTQAEPLRG